MTVTPTPARIGRYRIVSEIGRGAMGVVYRAEDEKLGRSVAIKTILASVGGEDQEGYLARFRQEAKALGGLNHPAIITVYEFGDQDGIAYMAMEFLEGRELRDMQVAGRVPLPVAVDIVAQVAEGLAFAHSHGIVHRDVKPANIMVLAGNRAKVMDFGIARVRASDVKTQTGLLLGSPKYMSPEQVLGQAIDQRADIFSLGVVLYEMVAGAPPFTGQDIHQLMFQVCQVRQEPPSHLNPAVPSVLDLIIAKALEKDVEARYQDAAQLASDLRASLGQLVDVAVPVASAAGDTTVPMAPEPERTQARGGAPLALPAVGLHVSRRHDSAAAIRRLAQARGEDRQAMSPSETKAHGASRMLADRSLMAAVGILGLAVAISAAILLT